MVGLAAAMLFGAAFAFGAEQTWKGKISDDKCGHTHKAAIEHAGTSMSEADCVKACVKSGAKYVLTTKGGKTYKISNQDFAGLAEHAGHKVEVTGAMTGDTIKVTQVAARGKKS
jgi:hypothetical protein